MKPKTTTKQQRVTKWNDLTGAPRWHGRTAEPTRTSERLCNDGHAACGCRFTDYTCCLNCPRPVCALDEIDAGVLNPRAGLPVPVPGIPAAERAVQVVELLERGKTPPEIRAELGISRCQYIRAMAIVERRPRIAVRHLLQTGTFEPGHVIQLTTYFHLGGRDTVDKIVREERHRLALGGGEEPLGPETLELLEALSTGRVGSEAEPLEKGPVSTAKRGDQR